MRSRRPLALAALSAVVAVAALAAAQDPASLRSAIATRYPAVAWVDVPTLARWLAPPPAQRPMLLDARSEAEFDVSHIQGARRIDPDHPDIEALGDPDGRRVVVYCSVGWRSAAVADALRRAGFPKVYNLQGGIFAWVNSGHPVVNARGPTPLVHPYDAVWGRMLDPDHRAPLPN